MTTNAEKVWQLIRQRQSIEELEVPEFPPIRNVLICGWDATMITMIDGEMKNGYIVVIDPTHRDTDFMNSLYDHMRNQFTYILMDPSDNHSPQALGPIINGYSDKDGNVREGYGQKFDMFIRLSTYISSEKYQEYLSEDCVMWSSDAEPKRQDDDTK